MVQLLGRLWPSTFLRYATSLLMAPPTAWVSSLVSAAFLQQDGRPSLVSRPLSRSGSDALLDLLWGKYVDSTTTAQGAIFLFWVLLLLNMHVGE